MPLEMIRLEGNPSFLYASKYASYLVFDSKQSQCTCLAIAISYLFTEYKISCQITILSKNSKLPSASNKLVGVSTPGVLGPTSKLSPRAPAQMGRRETEREGGNGAGGRQA
jgi:hypothetical protein